jgi:two-component system nitrogen regulation sensor histidine kinase NtrY
MRPITDLITASEQVSYGNLNVRVDPTYALDEFKMLGHAFNRMTERIENQQGDLVNANAQMDFRRRFTETILGGVSTGVLSVDKDRRITLANNAAAELLYSPIESLIGQKINYIIPDLSIHLDEAFEKSDVGVVRTCEVQVRRRDKAVRIFMARIVIEVLDNNMRGAIITFDDLTAVLANQRKAAWADIARRIAHEIKNPLTPIQLSAERLNRKYGKNLDEKNKAVFNQCTETITRHVNDIKIMVNSFSEFAKMPDADIRNEDILPVIQEVYMLNKQAHSKIKFSLETSFDEMETLQIPHDDQQIRQLLTNLVKNATEAMEDQDNGQIKFIIALENNRVIIGVGDNGPGLPEDVDHEKLSEPYVTHKAKGTGLGLAIVKKIVEDHHGDLMFNPDIPIIKSMKLDYSTLIAFSIPLSDERGSA